MAVNHYLPTGLHHHSDVFVDVFPVGPLQCNCTIIGNRATKQAVVIDPGGSIDSILKKLNAEDLSVKQILHTHAHFDHFLASGNLHKKTGAQLCLHPEDKFLWKHLEQQCQLFGVPYEPVPEPNHWLKPDEPIELLEKAGRCIFTPGHTPGSMSFLFADLQLLIAGDTLFCRGIGRTDLWGGDFKTIQHSITQSLFTLDESTWVITGHGRSTTIAQELRQNPILQK
ncbi:MAG: MBL fold metallo-hydrolase [Cyanobacteria bacterium P01_H01_bin.74]